MGAHSTDRSTTRICGRKNVFGTVVDAVLEASLDRIGRLRPSRKLQADAVFLRRQAIGDPFESAVELLGELFRGIRRQEQAPELGPILSNDTRGKSVVRQAFWAEWAWAW
jgi:hypothetical protein